jgi:hypothetical protein
MNVADFVRVPFLRENLDREIPRAEGDVDQRGKAWSVSPINSVWVNNYRF